MNRYWSTLLAAALVGGCATNAPSTANLAASVTAPAAVADENHEEMTAGGRLLHWPVNLILDFYDIFGLNFGTGRNDYPFGAKLQFTKAIRLGILDMADFELLGLNSALHDDDSSFWNFDRSADDYKVGAKLGAGAGAMASLDLYEIYDWVVGVVTFNQVNPGGDHMDHH